MSVAATNFYVTGGTLDRNAACYVERQSDSALLDALRALEKSTVLREGLGEEVTKSYLKLRHDDWNAYSRHLTDWERNTTLDC